MFFLSGPCQIKTWAFLSCSIYSSIPKYIPNYTPLFHSRSRKMKWYFCFAYYFLLLMWLLLGLYFMNILNVYDIFAFETHYPIDFIQRQATLNHSAEKVCFHRMVCKGVGTVGKVYDLLFHIFKWWPLNMVRHRHSDHLSRSLIVRHHCSICVSLPV